MIENRGRALVFGGPADLVYDVARIARAQFLLKIVLNEVDQGVGNLKFKVNSALDSDPAEDLAELLWR